MGNNALISEILRNKILKELLAFCVMGVLVFSVVTMFVFKF